MNYKELKLYGIKKITNEEATKIIESREPIGVFIVEDEKGYTGIDNSDGEAWTEDFKNEDNCILWLLGVEKIE